MKTFKSTVTTELICSDDGLYTYEVIKNLVGVEGECAYIISLYPTRNESNIFSNDSTLNYLVTHMTDVGINELHIINLYSKVVNGKMSVKGLQIDVDNMKYIEEIMGSKKFQSSKCIISWGNSFQTSTAITESKKKIFNMFLERNPKNKLYQLCLVGKNLNSDVAPHPLYLGINGSNLKWGLKEFNINVNDSPNVKNKISNKK